MSTCRLSASRGWASICGCEGAAFPTGFILRSAPKERVSNHEAAPWFETPGCAGLLTMRAENSSSFRGRERSERARNPYPLCCGVRIRGPVLRTVPGMTGHALKIIIPRTIDFAFGLALYSQYPAPVREGCLISVSRCWGGERWPGRGVGDAAQIPLPAVQAARSRRALPRVTGADLRVPREQKPPVASRSTRSRQSRGQEATPPAQESLGAVDSNGSSTGGRAEQAEKHRARNAEGSAFPW